METVTLKRGRGAMTLTKSNDLIAIRPSPQAQVAEVLANSPAETSSVGTNLGEYEIVKVSDRRQMEGTLDDLKSTMAHL